jgi:hypothetical protein
MKINLKLNKDKLRIENNATFSWGEWAITHHYGAQMPNGHYFEGFPWIDITHQQVNVAELMTANIKTSSSLNEAFEKTAQQLNDEYKATLELAPKDHPLFNYPKLSDSQSMEFTPK